jgi:hypothetical protein
MTFIHAYLLGGLVLAGVPVLLHLILRQRPKRLAFPAFRFLKARRKINQRKMQLQHLLLLLLRVLVLVALCLALARPRLFAHRLGSSSDRAVVAALLFDTSASMGYAVGGVTRLDDARSRAKELLAELKPDSRAAVLDAGEDAQAVLLPPAEARARLDLVRVRPGAGSLNGAVERALRFLEKQDAGEEGPPRLLYIFSDRTRPSWDAAGLRPNVPPGVTVYFVDVGAEAPRDLGIDRVEVVPPVVAPGARFEVRVGVRGTAGGHENELSLVIDGEDRPPDRRPVRIDKGLTSDTVVFERVAPTPPATAEADVPYQLTARLGTRDAMPFNNARHATFHVRAGRKLLTLVETRDDDRTRVWQAAHAANRSACEVLTFGEADKLDATSLGRYSVIALFQAAEVPGGWWQRLAAHARAGGGVAVVPGGDEVGLAAFNKQGLDAEVLPAALVELVTAPDDRPAYWAPFSAAHPLTAPFVAWMRTADPDFGRAELRPFARRYWEVRPAKGAVTVASYEDAKGNPALVERPLGKGRVVLFTTPLDIRFTDDTRRAQWNNYWESSFGLVLIDRASRYLGGEVTAPLVNFTCGQPVRLSLGAPPEPPLTLAGPGLSGAERAVKPPGEDGAVALPQAVAAGHYQLLDGKGQVRGAFSLDVAPREGDLDRVPVEELEEALGTGAVVQVGRSVTIKEVLAATQQPPIELLPYLMMLLLAVLTLEGLLANRFYRRASEPGGAS